MLYLALKTKQNRTAAAAAAAAAGSRSQTGRSPSAAPAADRCWQRHRHHLLGIQKGRSLISERADLKIQKDRQRSWLCYRHQKSLKHLQRHFRTDPLRFFVLQNSELNNLELDNLKNFSGNKRSANCWST